MGKYGKRNKAQKEQLVKDAVVEEVENDPIDPQTLEEETSNQGHYYDNNDSDEVSKEGVTNNDMKEKRQKKIVQNLVSVIVLLAGLLLGSILVDVAQLATGQGFSQKAINSADVFEINERTWVAYDEPIVDLAVITDKTCEECEPDQALVFLRRYLPTIFAKNVDVASTQGKKMAEEYNIKTLPAFVFTKTVEETPFYLQAQPIFEAQGEEFVLNTSQLGLPVGKYLELPEIREDSIKIGSDNAPVKIIEFSDFQCPFCQALHPAILKTLQDYSEDEVQFVYKHLPLGFHSQANNAALASECAHEQEAFMKYADLLYDKQSQWGESQGVSLFKQYAVQLRLRSGQFNQCLDSKKYQDKIDMDQAQAQEFGLTGTPSTFINGEFLGGAADYSTIRTIIDGELSGNMSSVSEEVMLEEGSALEPEPETVGNKT